MSTLGKLAYLLPLTLPLLPLLLSSTAAYGEGEDKDKDLSHRLSLSLSLSLGGRSRSVVGAGPLGLVRRGSEDPAGRRRRDDGLHDPRVPGGAGARRARHGAEAYRRRLLPRA